MSEWSCIPLFPLLPALSAALPPPSSLSLSPFSFIPPLFLFHPSPSLFLTPPIACPLCVTASDTVSRALPDALQPVLLLLARLQQQQQQQQQRAPTANDSGIHLPDVAPLHIPRALHVEPSFHPHAQGILGFDPACITGATLVEPGYLQTLGSSDVGGGSGDGDGAGVGHSQCEQRGQLHDGHNAASERCCDDGSSSSSSSSSSSAAGGGGFMGGLPMGALSSGGFSVGVSGFEGLFTSALLSQTEDEPTQEALPRGASDGQPELKPQVTQPGSRVQPQLQDPHRTTKHQRNHRASVVAVIRDMRLHTSSSPASSPTRHVAVVLDVAHALLDVESDTFVRCAVTKCLRTAPTLTWSPDRPLSLLRAFEAPAKHTHDLQVRMR